MLKMQFVERGTLAFTVSIMLGWYKIVLGSSDIPLALVTLIVGAMLPLWGYNGVMIGVGRHRDSERGIVDSMAEITALWQEAEARLREFERLDQCRQRRHLPARPASSNDRTGVVLRPANGPRGIRTPCKPITNGRH